MFADVATIEIKAGKGGDGRSSFRHEKYIANGGPDGGDGGRGGDVICVAYHNTNTLSTYRTVRTIAAEDGAAGGSNRSRGKGGDDIIVKVPPGTQLWDGDKLLADLHHDGDQVVLARGGRGGYGNAHFVSSVRQAPRTAEFGELGESLRVRLELKLVADVGLVGLPNAGKSTLLSVISNAKPEIADYAFTTLTPNLGVVDHRAFTFMVADIPGLIEGASTGKGLGDEFLRHVERTAVLLHLVDGSNDDVAAEWRTIDAELAAYGHGLDTKPRVTVLTKIDALLDEEIEEKRRVLTELCAGRNSASDGEDKGEKVFIISASAHRGLTALLDYVVVRVREARDAAAALEAETALPVITEVALPDHWHVEADVMSDGAMDGDAASVMVGMADSDAAENQPRAWRVVGERIEGFARRTNFDQDDGVERLRDILRKTGVARELRRQGAKAGDEVHFGEQTLSWLD